MIKDSTIERIEKPIKRLQDLQEFCEDMSIDLSLFGSEQNFHIETTIRWLESIAQISSEIAEELRHV